MRKYTFILLLTTTIVVMSGCSTKYLGTGLNDFRSSSETIAESMTGMFSEIINEDMELRAERSVRNSSVTISALEPGIITFQNMRLRKVMLNSLVEYSGLLKALFGNDHVAHVKEYGNKLKKDLESIYLYNPGIVSKNARGVISTMITMVPEGFTFIKKKRFALRMMIEMQKIIEKMSGKLKEEIISLKLLAPNLYTRLFRVKVEDKWPEKIDKRLKYALVGVKIIRKRERFRELAGDLLKIMEIFPSEHKKLITSFKKNGGKLNGLNELINYSIRLKNSYDLLSQGE